MTFWESAWCIVAGLMLYEFVKIVLGGLGVILGVGWALHKEATK